MLTQQRKAHILAVLKQTGQVVAKSLSEQLDLSEDTIRRDLRELAAEGLLQRVHGGALPASPALADFSGRQAIATDGKKAIGRAAAAMIRPGQVVFVDGGTTTVQLVRHLPPELEATIITHSPSIAVELVSHPRITVELIGGRLFKHSVVAVGASAIEAIARYRADIYFMGVTGIHPETGLTTGDSEEAAVKRALSRHAAETIVLASSEKLGAASPYVILPMNEIQGLIVERGTRDETMAAYPAAGVSVTVA
ncbi:DeoR/GlpR family DNA-binding transcription regulator [Phyllobacterium myrsinacearum]|uniref:DeoR family transcriptional regulator n=1 Tax=Phyllobacterium myrsinacearum TaxID=28101 RepID=A0A2S9JX25_9HYPH|nr:DeoR/GlpR family DNA-binding transcription regulator [Phyllobacterium myrsinacearum]PRD57879.1 DeoR family transcriptional regulator [Phyllobacterium myrsinacearum]PWV96047.1 DeoR family transcriptional regulator [Phyllobacterium myrsinacearum]RZV09962.1 DeoR family transcriptional regulator [Phyllobacterium myrsinacearum]